MVSIAPAARESLLRPRGARPSPVIGGQPLGAAKADETDHGGASQWRTTATACGKVAGARTAQAQEASRSRVNPALIPPTALAPAATVGGAAPTIFFARSVVETPPIPD